MPSFFDRIRTAFNNRTGNLKLLDYRSNNTKWSLLHPTELGNFYDFQHPNQHPDGALKLNIPISPDGTPLTGEHPGGTHRHISEHLAIPQHVARSHAGSSHASMQNAVGLHRVVT
jgi:hypothetical protein